VKLGRERLRLDIASGEVLRLESASSYEVAVDEGRVWLTEDGDARDVWLTAGQHATLSGRGLAVIEAVRDARVRVGAPKLLS
jgi:hypothetical protein